MEGWLMKVYSDEQLTLIEFFNFIKIGIGYPKFEYGSAKCLTLGLWRFEVSLTLGYRRKSEFAEMGEA